MKVTTFAVRRRIAAAVISIALVVLGIYSFMLMPVNFLPEITYPLIKIHIWWRGATPELPRTASVPSWSRSWSTARRCE